MPKDAGPRSRATCQTSSVLDYTYSGSAETPVLNPNDPTALAQGVQTLDPDSGMVAWLGYNDNRSCTI